jgi:hypothetical protein
MRGHIDIGVRGTRGVAWHTELRSYALLVDGGANFQIAPFNGQFLRWDGLSIEYSVSAVTRERKSSLPSNASNA